MDNANHTTKRCKDCGETFPLTRDYFHRHSTNKDGFYGRCKSCAHIRYRQQTTAKERRKPLQGDHKECSTCKRILPATTTFFYKSKDGSGGVGNDCKECHKAKSSANYIVHREEISLQNAVYRKSERVKQRRRELYHANPDRVKARVKVWKANNPDKLKAQLIKRKALKREATGSFTASDIRLQMKAQGDNCWWCGKALKGKYHIDHRIPLIKSLDNSAENIVIACPSCNLRKNSKTPAEFMGRLF